MKRFQFDGIAEKQVSNMIINCNFLQIDLNSFISISVVICQRGDINDRFSKTLSDTTNTRQKKVKNITDNGLCVRPL